MTWVRRGPQLVRALEAERARASQLGEALAQQARNEQTTLGKLAHMRAARLDLRTALQLERADAQRELEAARDDAAKIFRARKLLARELEAERAKTGRLGEALVAKGREVQRLWAKIWDERAARERAQAQLNEERATALAGREAIGREREEAFLAKKQLARELAGAQQQTATLADRLKTTTALLADMVRRVGTVERSSEASPASLDGAVLFQLGQAFQLGGELGMAAACYRGCGRELPELIGRSASPDGAILGPDFLIIGSPRAATTWLRKHLSWHPDVFLLEQEQHYFEAPDKPLADYLGKFASPGEILWNRDPSRPPRSGGRLFGEKSPRYLAMPDANIALCAALFPRARLICVVREPIARAWSEIKHRGLDAHVGARNFRRGERFAEALDAVLRHGRYLESLRRWARHFLPAQMLLVDYEQLMTEPATVLDSALEHIGAKPIEVPPHFLARRIGPTRQAPPPRRLTRWLEDAYADDSHDIPTLRRAMDQAAVRLVPASPVEGAGSREGSRTRAQRLAR